MEVPVSRREAILCPTVFGHYDVRYYERGHVAFVPGDAPICVTPCLLRSRLSIAPPPPRAVDRVIRSTHVTTTGQHTGSTAGHRKLSSLPALDLVQRIAGLLLLL